jgi:hypothetical protein
MKISDKRQALILSILGVLALVAGLVSTARDPREQTITLERIGAKLTHAKSIPPETEDAVRALMTSTRQNASAVGGSLGHRQELALKQIDDALAAVPTVASVGGRR